MSIEAAQEQPLPGKVSRMPVRLDGPIADLDQAWRLAGILAQSNLLPKDLRQAPANVFVTILYGRELGLAPMQAIQGIYVVEGRPSLSAQSWRAMAIDQGHKVFVPCQQCGRAAEEHRDADHRYAADQSDTHCTITCRRKDGAEHSASYRLEEAVQSGKVTIKDGKPHSRSQNGKPLPWETVTQDMLTARATARCLRFACPEIALGFTATEEEEPQAADLNAALAAVVDARMPAPPADQQPENAAQPETVDAEVVEDATEGTGEPGELTDEDIRQHVLDLAAEHDAEMAENQRHEDLFGDPQ